MCSRGVRALTATMSRPGSALPRKAFFGQIEVMHGARWLRLVPRITFSFLPCARRTSFVAPARSEPHTVKRSGGPANPINID